MALIKCPECGKEVSDKAPACIHCGFPFELLVKENDNLNINSCTDTSKKDNVISSNGCSIELINYATKKIQVAMALKNCMGMKDCDALELVAKAPCFIIKGENEVKIKELIIKLDSLPIEYKLYIDGKLKRHKEKDDIQKINNSSSEQNMLGKKICCPSCKSLIPETSRNCPICSFEGISSYLLQLEREKESKVIDYTYGHNYIPLKAINDNIPKCPTCQSTNIDKISSLSKAGSVALWGIFSQKVKKQWHCNKCGSEW